MSRLSVASRYAPLYLSTWFGGKEKVTVCWQVLGVLTTMSMLLDLAWLMRVWCAIGCALVRGLGASITLGGGALTLGACARVCISTLGIGACVGAGSGACNTLGGDAGIVT